MKLQDLVDLANDNPDMLDYDMCLSDFFRYDDDEEVTLVSDFPIMAVASNDESKEIRFVMKGADLSLLKESRDRVHQILHEKGFNPGDYE